MKNVPNFLCVGGAKCGTTSLYEYLRQHPNVFLPSQKELHFFSYPELASRPNGPGMSRILSGLCKSESEYFQFFRSAKPDQVIGDISPSYLVTPEAIPRIKNLLGCPKIIILLRNPVERVFSQYMHLRRAAREDLSFLAALESEPQRIASGWGDMWHYARSGFYSECVANYLKNFGSDNVLVIFNQDLKRDPNSIMREVFEFLGVDSRVEVDTAQEFNLSGLPKSKFLARTLDASLFANIAKRILPRRIGSKIKAWLQGVNTGRKEEIDPEVERSLRLLYERDVQSLEELLGQTTGWLEDGK